MYNYKDEQERRQIYTAVLEYEQDTVSRKIKDLFVSFDFLVRHTFHTRDIVRVHQNTLSRVWKHALKLARDITCMANAPCGLLQLLYDLES